MTIPDLPPPITAGAARDGVARATLRLVAGGRDAAAGAEEAARDDAETDADADAEAEGGALVTGAALAAVGAAAGMWSPAAAATAPPGPTEIFGSSADAAAPGLALALALDGVAARRKAREQVGGQGSEQPGGSAQ